MNILAITMVAILICMCLTLVRLLLGPSVFDRLLAANSFGTKTVLLLALIGFLFGRPDFLDLAIIYALINFVGVIAALRFVKMRNVSESEHPLQ
jgi:multicomponent Na+:H+ antiporter subunit F